MKLVKIDMITIITIPALVGRTLVVTSSCAIFAVEILCGVGKFRTIEILRAVLEIRNVN
jgi:hypothetical protein